MTPTPTIRKALVALHNSGGSGALDKQGHVLAAGEILGPPFSAQTWLKAMTIGLIETAGPGRVKLTEEGQRIAGAH